MKLGVLGGSGLYEIEGLSDVRERALTTPFGAPSDAFVCGRMGGCEVYFLPRHGRGHTIVASEINHRANIYAMKMLGVERVISISAVGSLREELRPCDIVLPDQYFDRTKQGPAHTFFGQGIAVHVSFGDPACPVLREQIAAAVTEERAANAAAKDVRLTPRGVYVNMEGPAFSTRAESVTYQKLGFDVIGMTSLAEAKLCREAELCYQAVAMVTDYDCWRAAEDQVNVEMIVANMRANVTLAKSLIVRLAQSLPAERTCHCGEALRHAILTAPAAIPAAARARLAPFLDKYLPPR